jgi:hypothetical protein
VAGAQQLSRSPCYTTAVTAVCHAPQSSVGGQSAAQLNIYYETHKPSGQLGTCPTVTSDDIWIADTTGGRRCFRRMSTSELGRAQGMPEELVRSMPPHSKRAYTQQDAIGGQGGHSAKRPDWACKPNHFPVSVSQKENFAIFARAFSTLQAQLWQLGAGARVRRHPVVNQGALRTRD